MINSLYVLSLFSLFVLSSFFILYYDSRALTAGRSAIRCPLVYRSIVSGVAEPRFPFYRKMQNIFTDIIIGIYEDKIIRHKMYLIYCMYYYIVLYSAHFLAFDNYFYVLWLRTFFSVLGSYIFFVVLLCKSRLLLLATCPPRYIIYTHYTYILYD